jgi:hypothetical protein
MDLLPARRNDEATTSELDFRQSAFEARMDPHVEQLEHRFDLFEYKLLSLIDRRLCAQTWMLMLAMMAVVGTVAAAVRL